MAASKAGFGSDRMGRNNSVRVQVDGGKRVRVTVGWTTLACWICMFVTASRADYNCSSSPVAENDPDFKSTFKSAFESLNLLIDASRMLSDQMSAVGWSLRSNRSLHMWGNCTTLKDKNFCKQCMEILQYNIQYVCHNSSWGDINVPNDCTLHYNASDYIIAGWDRSTAKTLITYSRHSFIQGMGLLFLSLLSIVK